MTLNQLKKESKIQIYKTPNQIFTKVTKIYKIYYFHKEILRCISMINFLIKRFTKRKFRDIKKMFLKITIYFPQKMRWTNKNMKANYLSLQMRILPVNMTQMDLKLFLFQDICRMRGEPKNSKRI